MTTKHQTLGIFAGNQSLSGVFLHPKVAHVLWMAGGEAQRQLNLGDGQRCHKPPMTGVEIPRFYNDFVDG